MARYFLQLRDCQEETLDPEGSEHPTVEALRRFVLSSVRDLITGDVRNGVIDFRFRVDAEDADGVIVYSLPFKDAVNIIPAAA